MKRTISLSVISCLILLLVFVSCAIETTPSNPPSQTYLVCDIPILSPLPETSLKQSKGGIEITLTPAQYSAKVEIKRFESEDVPPLIAFAPKGATKYIKVVETPVISVSPDILTFHLLITNLLPRVFRGAGSVVQYTIGGKGLHVTQESYSQLTDAIIPPRQQAEIYIYGPTISEISKEKSMLGVFVYDIVTKVDQAGNILEKQNFEWFIELTWQKHEEYGPPRRVSHYWR